MTFRKRLWARRRGQGMTEYIVITGLIGLLLLAAVLRFSDQIKKTFIGSTSVTEKHNLEMALGGPGGSKNQKKTLKGAKPGDPDVDYYWHTDGAGWSKDQQ